MKIELRFNMNNARESELAMSLANSLCIYIDGRRYTAKAVDAGYARHPEIEQGRVLGMANGDYIVHLNAEPVG